MLMCCTISTAAGAETLKLSTGELPPYATQERADDGIALNIVRQAFARVGYNVTYQYLPWKRSLENARAGLSDGTAHWGKNPDRDKGFLISDNVMTEQWVFLYRDDRQFDWHTLNDLIGLRIGATKSYTYTPEFWRMQKSGTLTVDLAEDDISNLRKLVAGRVDVVPLDRNVACYLLDAHFTAEQAAHVRAHTKLLTPNFTTHLMMSRKLPASAARVAAFNRGLQILRKSGDYDKLLRHQPCRTKLAEPALPGE